MHCPFCNTADSKVIDSRLAAEGSQIRRLGERDVRSRTIGEIVMKALFVLDHVAYVRFASVYQDFQDINAFRDQIEQMQDQGQTD